MQDEMKNLELFEQYHAGELGSEEAKFFEEKLLNDPSFKKEYEAFLTLIKGIELFGDEHLKTEIGKAHDTLKANHFFKLQNKIMDTQKKSSSKLMGIAAAIVCLLAAGYFIMKPGASGDRTDLFSQYVEKDYLDTKGVLATLTSPGFADTEAGRKDTLAGFIEQYDTGEYEEARVNLVNYLESYPEDEYAKFYLGMSLLQKSMYSKAVKHLQPLAKNANFDMNLEAKWYLALCYTTFKDAEMDQLAKGLLQDVVKNGNKDISASAAEMLTFIK